MVSTVSRDTSRDFVESTIRREPMSVISRLWREASLVTDLEAFLDRVGASLLDDLDANVLVVRLLHAGHLRTVGSIRRGAIGVSHPARPRTELSASALSRVTEWLAGGESPSERYLLRGVTENEEVWSFAPLVAGNDATGV